jgi:hypothetical protein
MLHILSAGQVMRSCEEKPIIVMSVRPRGARFTEYWILR